jgi:hypothetical protein
VNNNNSSNENFFNSIGEVERINKNIDISFKDRGIDSGNKIFRISEINDQSEDEMIKINKHKEQINNLKKY